MSPWDREQGSRPLWPALLQLQPEERKHSFRPFPHLIFLLPEMISQSPFVPKSYSNTSGASAAFRVNTAKMCVWRSRVTANSRWSRKQNYLISATIYLRLTALLPWCFWAVGNISWRTLLNWDSTSGRLNVKDDVILEVRVHFRNSQESYTSNKDNEIEKKKKRKKKNRTFLEEQSARGCAEELMAERNSQWKTVRNTKAGREPKHK